MDGAFRVAAGGERTELARPKTIQQDLGHDGSGTVTGAEEEDLQRAVSH